MDELRGFKLKNVFDRVQWSDEQFLEWFQHLGLLHSKRSCECGSSMRLREKPPAKYPLWQYPKKKCRKEQGFLVDTFFEDTHLRLKKAFQLAYYWSRKMTSVDELMFQIQEDEASSSLSRHTICDWKSYFREICQRYFVEHRTILGGPGKIVKIDETVSVRRKYNRGRLLPTKWIFGGVERGTNKVLNRSFMFWVENRDTNTLLDIIQQYILPGTTIISDGWPSYRKIRKLPEGYEHLAVNHSEHFVDPITGAHTNSIESAWQKLKARNKKEYGTASSEFGSYIEQHLWFQMFCGPDCFYNLMSQICGLYPCERK